MADGRHCAAVGTGTVGPMEPLDHDATYKAIYGHRFMVEELARWLIPAQRGGRELVDALDFGTLARVQEQSVAGGRRRSNDIVWRVRFRDGDDADPDAWMHLVVEHTCNDVSVVAGVFLARRGREVVPGYVEWAQRGEGRTGDHPKGAPTKRAESAAHLLCCRLSTYARYAFEATPRMWSALSARLVDALTRHCKCVRPLVLMLEFQSEVDFLMALRCRHYVDSFHLENWRGRRFKATDRLPPVLAFVIYNGASRWSAARRVIDLVTPGATSDEPPHGLSRASPVFAGDGYVLLDSGRVGADDLKRDNAAALLAGIEHPTPETVAELVVLLRRSRLELLGWPVET